MLHTERIIPNRKHPIPYNTHRYGIVILVIINILPAHFAELNPIEFLALTVRHPVADDHWRLGLFVFGHFDDDDDVS